jgi:hypothetical protein
MAFSVNESNFVQEINNPKSSMYSGEMINKNDHEDICSNAMTNNQYKA